MYLRAESHNKVATIIFYFARAVSHAAVRTDRLCNVSSQRSLLPLPYNGLIFQQLRRGRLHLKQAFEKWVVKKEFPAGLKRSVLRAILGSKINFLACFFFKHKLHLILPIIMQKKSEIG